MKEIESNCLYCDINFIAIEHKSGECPNCKEKYEWDYDGDYGVDSVYGIQWLSTYPINKNKKTMKKQYVLIDRLKMVAIEEVAIGKAINNKERPLSEASIEAEAVLQVLNYLYEIDEWKPEYIAGIELIQNAKSGSTE